MKRWSKKKTRQSSTAEIKKTQNACFVHMTESHPYIKLRANRNKKIGTETKSINIKTLKNLIVDSKFGNSCCIWVKWWTVSRMVISKTNKIIQVAKSSPKRMPMFLAAIMAQFSILPLTLLYLGCSFKNHSQMDLMTLKNLKPLLVWQQKKQDMLFHMNQCIKIEGHSPLCRTA